MLGHVGSGIALGNHNGLPSLSSFSCRCAADARFGHSCVVRKEVIPAPAFRETTGISSLIAADERLLKKTVVVIDNYDSFTYNLSQYLAVLGCSCEVYRNDGLTVEELKGKGPAGVLISPGPGTPQDSGISLDTVLKIGPITPVFGVCMGLQCMGEAYGGRIVRSPYGVMHGKKSLVFYDEHGKDGLLAGLPNPFVAARYHSLVIDKQTFPHDELEITAWTEDGLIMGARHKRYPHVQGVQFHPESIITEGGMKIMRNFLDLIEAYQQPN